MFSIDTKTKKITITRGDYAECEIALKKDGQPFTPSGADTVTFGIKRAAMTVGGKQFVDREPIVTIDIPISTMTLIIRPEHTNKLDFGIYKYDIEYVTDGKPDTFINLADFEIRGEVLDNAD
jgi:hypothetical protein